MRIVILVFLISTALLNIACSKEKSSSKFNGNIIGKWEKIAEGTDEENIKSIEPDDEYIEYLSNGWIRMYDSLSEKYRDNMCKYQTDSRYLYYYSYYNGTRDKKNDFTYEYSFDQSNDELTLKYIQGNLPDRLGYPTIYVYKRIK